MLRVNPLSIQRFESQATGSVDVVKNSEESSVATGPFKLSKFAVQILSFKAPGQPQSFNTVSEA